MMPGRKACAGVIERNAIALLGNYAKPALDPPSPGWLGHDCNRDRVTKSGLWNSNHVDENYDADFLDQLERLVSAIGGGSMIVVIQCQGRKQPDAGRLKSADGKPVYFVARPELAPADDSLLYARPDDRSDRGMSWRQILLDYNRDTQNLFRLYPAGQLYTDGVYGRLAARFGSQNLFIPSAGWGLIRADFLTPD
jgi:hypothetical protein